jgi:hypothetical protein
MITKEKDNETQHKKVDIQIAYRSLAPAAVSKLERKGDEATTLTKNEILCIIFAIFHTLEDDKKKKGTLVDIVIKLAEKSPEKRHFFCFSLPCGGGTNDVYIFSHSGIRKTSDGSTGIRGGIQNTPDVATNEFPSDGGYTRDTSISSGTCI